MSIEVASSSALYSDHVNPQWAKLLDVLGMNLRYTRCSGAERPIARTGLLCGQGWRRLSEAQHEIR
jgi:hypothetical protein